MVKAASMPSISSGRSSGDINSSSVYEVIEFDDLGTELEIEKDSPAEKALRASAAVHVSRVAKAARAANMQVVRRVVKRATGITKQGKIKGKPPRLPPGQLSQFEEHSELEEVEEERINETAGAHQKNKEADQDYKDQIPNQENVNAGTAETAKKLLQNVDPHNIVKALRYKKKEGAKTKPSYVKGKVIDGEHELYALSIAVMIGVRTSISKTDSIINPAQGRRFVIPDDFDAQEKYEFRPKGDKEKQTPAYQLAHTFKFKDYAPVVFAFMRRLSGINEYDFLMSICGNASFIEFISNAKSGQFFFYSSDGRYMIKTMTDAECKFFRRILPDYFKHCCENPNTMITRFFGMYRVKLYHLKRNVKFVIMSSVYYTDKYLQSFYDLKGSVIGRDAKPHHAVKKDNDLRKLLPQEALALRPVVRAKVRKQLESDTLFMQKMGIMDYSMLVGIHHVPPASDRPTAFSGYRMSMRKSNRQSVRNLARSIKSIRNLKEFKSGNFNTIEETKDDSEEEARPVGLRNAPSKRLLSEDLGTLLSEGCLEDDDSSYLEGSDNRSNRVSRSCGGLAELKKEATIESLFWPFHRLFDLHGHRRMYPGKCPNCEKVECDCPLHPSLKRYKIPSFIPPLSDRKDGGFEMDTTGLSMPLIYKGPNGDQQYEGKIFYMGIIDVLQEFNSRKVVEAKYRSFQTSSKHLVSCVNPKLYGHRFVDFFDEYTTRNAPEASKSGEQAGEGVEITLEVHQQKEVEQAKVEDPKDISDTLPT